MIVSDSSQWVRKKVIRVARHLRKEALDAIAREEPLEIRVDTAPISITMRTPGCDEELGLGFLVAEGILRKQKQVVKVEPSRRNRDGNVLEIFLAPEVKIDLATLTRHVFASSSCGLCGKATIASVRRHFAPLRDDTRVELSVIASLSEKLRTAQTTFARTGGLHAAGLFDSAGKLQCLREDVGRHNAVDKILGWALQRNLIPLRGQILLVSGRASFEIMQKALAGGISIVAAVSAPSSLAIEFARRSGQTLIGFLREQRLNIYSGSRRVLK